MAGAAFLLEAEDLFFVAAVSDFSVSPFGMWLFQGKTSAIQIFLLVRT